MLFRTISTACLLLSLGLVAPACDDKKPDAKTDAKGKTDEKKVDEKKVDVKVEEKKAEAKVDEAKVDEAKVDEAKVDEAKVDDAKVDAKVVDPKVEEKKADPKKPAVVEPKVDPGPAVDAKGLFEKKCKTCHNSNGDAKTKIGEENDIADWTQAGWKAKWTQAKVEDILNNGKATTKMKSFKDKLTPDELVAVAKYARTLGK